MVSASVPGVFSWRYLLSFCAACVKSRSSIALYRFHIFSDLCPTIFMAVAVSTPALRRFVEAQWRRSWNRKSVIPASFSAVLKDRLIR